MKTTANEERPASRLALYRAWLDQRWAEWRQINGLDPRERVSYFQYKAFDAWLQFRNERNRLDPADLPAASSAA